MSHKSKTNSTPSSRIVPEEAWFKPNHGSSTMSSDHSFIFFEVSQKPFSTQEARFAPSESVNYVNPEFTAENLFIDFHGEGRPYIMIITQSSLQYVAASQLPLFDNEGDMQKQLDWNDAHEHQLTAEHSFLRTQFEHHFPGGTGIGYHQFTPFSFKDKAVWEIAFPRLNPFTKHQLIANFIHEAAQFDTELKLFLIYQKDIKQTAVSRYQLAAFIVHPQKHQLRPLKAVSHAIPSLDYSNFLYAFDVDFWAQQPPANTTSPLSIHDNQSRSNSGSYHFFAPFNPEVFAEIINHSSALYPTFGKIIGTSSLDLGFPQDLPLPIAPRLHHENYIPQGLLSKPENPSINSAATIDEEQGKYVILGKKLKNGLKTGLPAFLPKNMLNSHVAVFGGTGSGKTTLSKILLDEIIDNSPSSSPIGVLYINLAKSDQQAAFYPYMDQTFTYGDYLLEIPYIPNFWRSLGSKSSPKPTLDQILKQVADTLTAALGLSNPIDSIIHGFLKECRKMDEFPMDLYWLLHDTLAYHDGSLKSTQPHPSKTPESSEPLENHGYGPEVQQNIHQALLNRLNSFMNPYFKHISKLQLERHPPWLQWWFKGSRIFLDLSSCPVDIQRYIVVMIFQMISWFFPENTGESENTLNHLVILDEAHRVFQKPLTHTPNDDDITSSGYLEKIVGETLRECRSKGVGVMIMDQSPKELFPSIYSHPRTRISFQLSPQDAALITSKPDVIETLETLPNRIAWLENQNTGESYLFHTHSWRWRKTEIRVPEYIHDDDYRHGGHIAELWYYQWVVGDPDYLPDLHDISFIDNWMEDLLEDGFCRKALELSAYYWKFRFVHLLHQTTEEYPAQGEWNLESLIGKFCGFAFRDFWDYPPFAEIFARCEQFYQISLEDPEFEPYWEHVQEYHLGIGIIMDFIKVLQRPLDDPERHQLEQDHDLPKLRDFWTSAFQDPDEILEDEMEDEIEDEMREEMDGKWAETSGEERDEESDDEFTQDSEHPNNEEA